MATLSWLGFVEPNTLPGGGGGQSGVGERGIEIEVEVALVDSSQLNIS